MKKILSIILLCLFVFSVSGCSDDNTPSNQISESKEEIKAVTLQSCQLDNEGMPWEKIGDYYIGLKIVADENGDILSEQLLAYKDFNSPQSIWTNDTSGNIGNTLISDGEDVFFSVINPYSGSENCGGTVYSISISNHKVKKIADIPDMNDLAAYYNGKIFYQRYSDTQLNTISLYQYDAESKESSCIEENFVVDSQYGNIIVGAPTRHDPNITYYCYDVESGKKTQLMDAFSVAVTGDKVYYTSYGADMSSTNIGYCSIDGTGDNIITTVESSDSFFVGREHALVLNYDGVLKAIDYESREVGNQSFPVADRILGNWENLAYTSMSDYILIAFIDDENVECTFPRDILQGTYTIDGNTVNITLTSGQSYSNVDCQWTPIDSIELKIEGTVNYNSMSVTVHDSQDWSATLIRTH